MVNFQKRLFSVEQFGKYSKVSNRSYMHISTLHSLMLKTIEVHRLQNGNSRQSKQI